MKPAIVLLTCTALCVGDLYPNKANADPQPASSLPLVEPRLPSLTPVPVPSPVPLPSPMPMSPVPELRSPPTPSVPIPIFSPAPMPALPQPAKLGPFNLDRSLNQLRTARTMQRREIIYELSDLRRSITPGLINALQTESDPLVKSAIAEALADRWKEASPAIDLLVTMLSDRRRALVPRDIESITSPSSIPSSQIAFPWSMPVRPISERYPSVSPGNPGNLLNISAIKAIGNIGRPAREKATPALTALLQDADAWVRVNALWALSEIGADVGIFESWLSVMQSPDPDAREAAAMLMNDSGSLLRKALGNEANPQNIQKLIPLLGDRVEQVRIASRNSFTLLGSAAVPALISALDHPEAIARLTAAHALMELGPAAAPATSALIKRLSDSGEVKPAPQPLNQWSPIAFASPSFSPGGYYSQGKPDPDEYLVRVNAALALGSIPAPEAIDSLKMSLQDYHPRMQLAAAWALIRLNQVEPTLPVLGQLLQQSNSEISSNSRKLLKSLGAPGAKYLLPELLKRFDASNPKDRESIVLEFNYFGSAALPALSRLRQVLTGSDRNARGYAVTVLANIYEDLDRENQRSPLSASDRTLAATELKKILQIITQPNASFNSPPVARLRRLDGRF